MALVIRASMGIGLRTRLGRSGVDVLLQYQRHLERGGVCKQEAGGEVLKGWSCVVVCLMVWHELLLEYHCLCSSQSCFRLWRECNEEC